MCLLDEVLEWDANRILCRSSTHRDLDNPLRLNGTLGAACGIEYAAQAMAIHGALIATAHAARTAEGSHAASANDEVRVYPTALKAPRPQVGYIASVRGVSLVASRIDDIAADLLATATRVHSDTSSALYEFVVEAGSSQTGGSNQSLLRGRVTLVFPS
jgi:predicted hotdog family 3-hydroxylacyl-ACP dehydratase